MSMIIRIIINIQDQGCHHQGNFQGGKWIVVLG